LYVQSCPTERMTFSVHYTTQRRCSMRTKKRVPLVATLLSLLGGLGVGLLVIGCASIAHGTKQKVNFSSVPPGATVTVDGRGATTTPAVAELSRKNEHDVKIE